MPHCASLTPQRLSQDVLRAKYTRGDETGIGHVQQRVAHALAEMEVPQQRHYWEAQFLHAQQAGFIPAGRILSGAGWTHDDTLMSCFVQPLTVASTHHAHLDLNIGLLEALQTMRCGGGVGYDFSSIAPSESAGPVSWIRKFDAACRERARQGGRRGAQMGVLRCDHPDIEAFIRAKETGGLTSFNLSVGMTDVFMQAIQNKTDIALVHSAEPTEQQKTSGAYFDTKRALWVYRHISAPVLWQQMMHATYDHAEPGVLFLDTINRDNNLHYCETIDATNPCAEQPLPPYGNCCLGSLDLTRFITQPFTPVAVFDGVAFAKTVRIAVRMLDNVLEITPWPLRQHQIEAQQKRRIGLGFTGLADALVMLNLRYDSPAAVRVAAQIAGCMRDCAYATSMELARERGAFPLWNATAYLDGNSFASRLPSGLRAGMRCYGVRNSHLLAIAPAGSISLACADNVSNGIEPVLAWAYTRKRVMPDGSMQAYAVQDHAWRLFRHLYGDALPLPPSFVTARAMDVAAQLAMVVAVSPFIDAGIAKTVNVVADHPYSDFQDVYYKAWQNGLKGLTTYRPNAVMPPVLCDDGSKTGSVCAT